MTDQEARCALAALILSGAKVPLFNVVDVHIDQMTDMALRFADSLLTKCKAGHVPRAPTV